MTYSEAIELAGIDLRKNKIKCVLESNSAFVINVVPKDEGIALEPAIRIDKKTRQKGVYSPIHNPDESPFSFRIVYGSLL